MKFLVIDGNSIVNRAFYGIRMLSNKKGVFTNGITGFLNIYFKLVKAENPDFVAVAFDLKAPTFRHQLYDGYKATRKGMPAELAQQMPYLKEILVAMGIRICEIEGYEADDILGTLSRISAENNIDCTVLTGDRDSFQLVNDKVKVHLASTKEDLIFDPQAIHEKYGVTPAQLIDVKALMGDPSDNIPGVAGIGEKTALSLIAKYGSLDNIYQDVSALDVSAGVKTKLENGKDSAYMSKQLAIINLFCPVDENIEHYRIGEGDKQRLAELLTELEMFKILSTLKLKAVEINTPQNNETATIKVDMPKSDVVLFYGDALEVLGDEFRLLTDINVIKTYLQSDNKKQVFNIKQLWHFAFEHEIEIENVIFDTTLAAYLLNVNASEYTPERLFAEYSIPFEEDDITANAVKKLNEKLYAQIAENNLNTILSDIEIPLAKVLSFMERQGIQLDKAGVKAFGEQLKADIERIEAEIYELAGKKFNIASPKQLGVVLFEDLGLPSGKKTKTGYSTNADVLDFLADKHPIIEKIKDYRSFTKLSSTYVDGLLSAVKEDGRLHTTFRQTETRTGRISSVEPNIQNIPVRTPLGRQMRRFFTAKDGYKLVDADYSQIELRVLADISGDENMIEAFKTGYDIHTATAAKVFNQPIEWVTPEMRSSAKAVNFGIVYGIGAFSLSKDIGVTVAEAKRYIEEYFANYPKIDAYMKNTVSQAKENGWVTTTLGRRRFIPELLSSNKILQAMGSRIAMNTPIQGSAADIIKLAMVKVFDKLTKSGLDAKLILQVHDELIVEAREDHAEQVATFLKDEMERAVKLAVPLVVDVEIGDSWYDTH